MTMLMHHMLRAAAGYAAPTPPSTDPQFNYVTMLLHGDGTNGAQNNTFVDSSTNNFTITRNGTPTQGSFSPYGDLWSNAFSGSGNSQFLSGSTPLLGSGDFTLEGWINPSTFQATFSKTIFDSRSGVGFFFGLDGSNNWQVYTTSTVVIYSTPPALNTWTHFAVVRLGSAVTLYVNGISRATGTLSTDLTSTSAYIARSNTSASDYFNGYVSNLRIVKGTALYTSNFTPSTTPLTAVSGTSLLTCQSNRFKDNSSNNFAITVTGTPSVQRFSPFDPAAGYDSSVIGGSGYFNGSTDSVNTPTSAAVLGTNNWTFECWVYLNAKPAFGQVMGMRKGTATSADQYVPVVIAITSTGFALYSSSNSTSWDIANGVAFGGTAVVNQWYHVAIVRNGSAIYGYVNGVQTTLVASTSANYTSTNSIFAGGAQASDRVNCYVSSARAVNGSAVYTSAFTPPTAPLTAVTNTSLLLNCINAGIFDNAMMNDLVTVGNAQVSTAVKKYGTGSMAFDGSGDYLTIPNSVNLTFGTGDFTVEAWVNLNVLGSDRSVIDFRSSTNSFGALYISGSGNRISFYDGTVTSSGTSLTAGSWNHVAWVRVGTTLYGYLNGVQQWSRTLSTNITTIGSPKVGADYNGSLSQMNGYIDDLRITKGVARYTANFTPPTAAFPNN